MKAENLIRKLKREARAAAKARGHKLDRLVTRKTIVPDKLVAGARCLRCGKEVWVDTKPAPNGINISGEALALGCED